MVIPVYFVVLGRFNLKQNNTEGLKNSACQESIDENGLQSGLDRAAFLAQVKGQVHFQPQFQIWTWPASKGDHLHRPSWEVRKEDIASILGRGPAKSYAK